MFKGELLSYQVDAVEQMVSQKKTLVAYEMGLGKTPMTLAAIEQLRDAKAIRSTVLVLCLSSLKYQWKAEIEKFSDSSALVVDGTPKQRAEQYAQLADHDYLVMNYEQVLSDWDILKMQSFSAVICDEATAIKGFRAKRAKKVKELSKRIPVRYALTGTPIENGKPEEVFSIMQFVNKDVLGRFDLFDKAFIVRNHFGGVQRYQNLEHLHTLLRDHVVRKTQNDEDVKGYLPDSVDRDPLLVPMDTQTKKLYNHIAKDLEALLREASQLFGASFSVSVHYGQGYVADGPENELRGKIMSQVTALRMLCSHPQLLVDSAMNYSNLTGKGSSYISSLAEKGLLANLSKTPKLDATISYLLEHLDISDTYKAVVFSSYLGSVDHIIARLKLKGITAVPYTGKMNAKEKEASKIKFQTEADTRVLVSSDAGGYGVDLPQANLLVNYDQPWSSGLALQRNGRINRASSTWSLITIQDILVKDSIEQRQHDMLKQKKSVANAVLDGSGINAKGGVDLTAGGMLEFLSSHTT